MQQSTAIRDGVRCDRVGAFAIRTTPGGRASVLACVLAGLFCAVAHAGGARPNVIVIVTDDQAPRTLGVDGNDQICTPRLDQMAAEGAYFRKAYVPLPQCAPSRAATLTGRYPHRLGVIANLESSLPEDAWTLGELFQVAGYRCGMIGKWHLGARTSSQRGFDDFWATRAVAGSRGLDRYRAPTLLVNGAEYQIEGFLTDVLTDLAIEFVESGDDRPFFLWMAHYAPHEPLIDPPDRGLHYDPSEIALPPSLADDLRTKPPQQSESALHAEFRSMGMAELRRRVAKYYAMISNVDMNVGRQLDHLAARGLAENTIVVFLSDNGWLCGEHQLYDKGPFLYDELVRTPLIVWAPGRFRAGQSIEALVSTIDLLPTLAEVAGIATPTNVDGVSFWPLLTGSASQTREQLYLLFNEKQTGHVFEPMLGVVTRQHKYSRYMRNHAEELYDLLADPFEMVNLASAPTPPPALSDMRRRVDEFAATFEQPFWLQAQSAVGTPPPTEPALPHSAPRAP